MYQKCCKHVHLGCEQGSSSSHHCLAETKEPGLQVPLRNRVSGLTFVSFNPDIVRCENRQLKSKEQKNLLNINKEEADGGNDKASEALPEDLNGGVDFLFSQRPENKSLSGLS